MRTGNLPLPRGRLAATAWILAFFCQAARLIGLSNAEVFRYGENAPAWRGPDDLSATWRAAWDDDAWEEEQRPSR